MNNTRKITTIILLFTLIGLFITGLFVEFLIFSGEVNQLKEQISTLQNQVDNMHTTINYQNVTYILGKNISLSELYENVKESIVVISGIVVSYQFPFTSYYEVQGSGFVYNFTRQMVIITNYHVVNGAINITVTFYNGNSYPAKVLGYDPYADLAILSVNAPQSEFKPLTIVSSSNLKVGDIVIAVGNPYGLAGSMSIGIVSALGRTISENTAGGFPIANIIQITAPINPGNSGGPLLNLQGQVVGITTAIISGSQGIGFAIPSDTILKEINDLITKGHYDKHSWLGIIGVDMTYSIAKAMNVNVTYGVLITQVVKDSPASKAGLRGGNKQVSIEGSSITIGGDIIIAVNGKRIRNNDDLASYLEAYTEPGQTINITVIRNNQKLTIPVTLGARPPPSSTST